MRLIAQAAVGAILVWLIVVHSFAAYLARVSPEMALLINGDQPAALIKLAKEQLRQHVASGANSYAGEASRLASFAAMGPAATDSEGSVADDRDASPTSPGPEQLASLRSVAIRALVANPVDSSALFLLGQIVEWEGDNERAHRLIEAAARRSFRETGAVYKMLLRSIEGRDYADAIDRADAIMRTAPEHTRRIVPLLARVMEDGEARRLVQQRLTQNPPWRTAFLETLPRSVTDPRRPLEVLLALKSSSAPPTEAELKSYLSWLIRHKAYELAYYTWLQFLSPDDLKSTGFLYNGRFERPLSGLPFDWVIENGRGVSIYLTSADNPELGRSLVVEFGQGRVEFGTVSQMVLLSPGTYRFTGQLKGELAGRRGLVWRVSCAEDTRAVLGTSEMMMGMAPTWRTFGFTFEVPRDRPCRAQKISLGLDARSASEQLVSGMVQYADFKIERL